MKYGLSITFFWRHRSHLTTQACSNQRRLCLSRHLCSLDPTISHFNQGACGSKENIPEVQVEYVAGQQRNRKRVTAFAKKSPYNFLQQPMKADITFLTTPTSDTPGTALLLSFTGKNYLFGHVHEGFQRAGLQRGLNLLKTKDHFLTGKTEWTNIGGVLGLILSNADRIASSKKSKADDAKEKLARRTVWEQEEQERVKSGMKPRKVAMPALRPEEEEEDPTLTFRSGPNLLHTLAAARSFIFRQGMPVEVEEYDRHHRHPEQEDEPSPDFADDHIRAWALSMVPKRVNSSDDSTPPQSPKKRSLEDYMEGQKEGDGHTISDRSRTNRGQLTPEQAIRAGVVEDMFKSQWNSQKLIEVPLHSVSASASIFVRDPETTMIIPYTGPMPGGKNGFPDIPVLVREPWPGALVHQLPVTHTSDIAMSYIVKTYEQRGKFLPKEAIRLGVRPGPDFSTLTRGSSVKAKDGTIVTPDMVLEPAKAPSGFAIFDMPSLDYLAALRESPEIQNPGLMHGIKHAVWLLGPGIVDDPSFTQLLATLKDIKHTVSSHSVCTNRTTMTTAAMEHYRHRLVDPDRFSPLVLDQQASEMTDEFKPYLVARTGLRLQITPDVRIEDAHIEPDFAPHSDVESLPPNIEDSTRDLWQQLRSEGHSSATLQQGLTSPQTEVICLGTGSMVPSLDRNVSATLVRVHGGGTYLLDCGENTLGQMRRLFSPIELSEIFNDLKLIWISHLHADHHLGTIAVIKAWYNEVYGKRNMTGATPPRPTTEQEFVQCLKQSPKLCVASNFYMARWLAEYAMVEDFGYDHILPLETTNRTSSHPSIFGYFKCFGLELSSMSDTA